MVVFKTMAMILCCLSYILFSTTGEATEYQAAIMAGSYCRMRYNFHQHKKYTTHITDMHHLQSYGTHYCKQYMETST